MLFNKVLPVYGPRVRRLEVILSLHPNPYVLSDSLTSAFMHPLPDLRFLKIDWKDYTRDAIPNILFETALAHSPKLAVIDTDMRIPGDGPFPALTQLLLHYHRYEPSYSQLSRMAPSLQILDCQSRMTYTGMTSTPTFQFLHTLRLGSVNYEEMSSIQLPVLQKLHIDSILCPNYPSFIRRLHYPMLATLIVRIGTPAVSVLHVPNVQTIQVMFYKDVIYKTMRYLLHENEGRCRPSLFKLHSTYPLTMKMLEPLADLVELRELHIYCRIVVGNIFEGPFWEAMTLVDGLGWMPGLERLYVTGAIPSTDPAVSRMVQSRGTNFVLYNT
jgi:hypothetical protein